MHCELVEKNACGRSLVASARAALALAVCAALAGGPAVVAAPTSSSTSNDGPRPAAARPVSKVLPRIRLGAAALSVSQWGNYTAPTFGTSETGAYAGAELFPGPRKFTGSGDSEYYHGVLPNGRFAKPAGLIRQIGMNPLGAAVTPDGKFLITSNDDERDQGFKSLKSNVNVGGYSLSVVDTATMNVVAQVSTGRFFVGLQVLGTGPYTVFASGGADQNLKVYTVTTAGAISAAASPVAIAPITPNNQGFVSNYTPAASFNTADAGGNLPAVPSGFARVEPTGTAAINNHLTFPTGAALSPDKKYLYVACNGDNSLAIYDVTTPAAPVLKKQVAVGYFPYGVSVSADGSKVYVTNWGVTQYKFAGPSYDASSTLTAIAPAASANQPQGFFVPPTNTAGTTPKTSSVSIISISNNDPTTATLSSSVYVGKALDALTQVGDTHPSAIALVPNATKPAIYVARSNDDSVAIIDPTTGIAAASIDLSLATGLVGAYPNAIATSSDGSRTYVAEAGINSVAVLNTSNPYAPTLLGRIPTGWYPTALALSPDNATLYVINAKGIGEDRNPKTQAGSNQPTGIESFTDGNYIFGAVQKVTLANVTLNNTTVQGYNVATQSNLDASVVPVGGAASARIKHVIFILHENKTFDSMLGSDSHYGAFASTTYNDVNGSPVAGSPTSPNPQYNSVAINTQQIARTFATAVNYYSDAEESDAGHQFCASGTATDYTEKTLLVKTGRGLLVNKNFEPEDYPAGGYIFNNAARNGVSFKDYGAMIRIVGTDTGTSTTPGTASAIGTHGRTTINDPDSGDVGYPQNNTSANPNNVGDVTSPVHGLGQTYFMNMPILAVLGQNNAAVGANIAEPHLDKNYPGYNFNISDQRRAKEFIADFDRMVAAGTLPTYLYIYQPNDHTGGVQAKNVAAPTAAQLVADGDVGLGMVVQHIMKSPIYYDAASNTGAAIFITYDDAQSTADHVDEHRTPLMLVSPFAKAGYVAKRHYTTASVVKTQELLMGLPPNNLGDLFATDLRDMFQSTYNGLTAANLTFNTVASYTPSAEGRKIWELVHKLDTSAPDRDSRRLGALGRLSMDADRLHDDAAKRNALSDEAYEDKQEALYKIASAVVNAPAPRDSDD